MHYTIYRYGGAFPELRATDFEHFRSICIELRRRKRAEIVVSTIGIQPSMDARERLSQELEARNWFDPDILTIADRLYRERYIRFVRSWIVFVCVCVWHSRSVKHACIAPMFTSRNYYTKGQGASVSRDVLFLTSPFLLRVACCDVVVVRSSSSFCLLHERSGCQCNKKGPLIPLSLLTRSGCFVLVVWCGFRFLLVLITWSVLTQSVCGIHGRLNMPVLLQCLHPEIITRKVRVPV